MFCPKCGEKLPDGSKFCCACGEKLDNVILGSFDEQETEDTPVADFVPPVDIPTASIVIPKKKRGGKKIIRIAVAAVACAAVLTAGYFGVNALMSKSRTKNAYALLSNGRYELITNLNKGQTIKIASSKSDDALNNMLAFSPDGKYIYYYTKVDTVSQTGSLCRAEYAKLKDDSSKNDKYIDIIATNVVLGFRFLNDQTITFKNGDRTLYCFNGKETSQIAQDVAYYYVDDSGKIIYTKGMRSEGYTLYGVDISDIDDKTKLASNVYNIVSSDDFENILYTKNEDDDTKTLYVVGFDKEAQKLAENVSGLTYLDDKVYFTAPNGKTLSLADYVEDTYADSDKKISTPDRSDFSIPDYSFEMVRGSNLSESDFDELYTSCNKALYYYGESSWSSHSMKESLSIDWGDNSDKLHAATQRFIDEFAGTADKDGYIRVTKEVKSALQEIAQTMDEPREDWQWLWLCYNKRQTGTTTDYDAYYEASDKWSEASNRIEMRKALKDKENDFAVRTLYCFDKGTLTTASENVLRTKSYTGAIMFNTPDLITEKVNLEDISYISEIRDLFEIDMEAQNHIILANGTSCKMSIDAAETVADALRSGSASLYFTNKEVYLNERNGALSVASLKGGVFDDFNFITDDAEVRGVDESTLYYLSGTYETNHLHSCDLYSYSNGSSVRLARDVLLSDLTLYSDGVVLAYTDYRERSGYELTMIDAKGNKTIIADEITQYIRVDNSTLLYISDGDLYSYNGKEKKLVKSNVDWIWSRNEMDISYVFGYDSFYDRAYVN